MADLVQGEFEGGPLGRCSHILRGPRARLWADARRSDVRFCCALASLSTPPVGPRGRARSRSCTILWRRCPLIFYSTSEKRPAHGSPLFAGFWTRLARFTNLRGELVVATEAHCASARPRVAYVAP